MNEKPILFSAPMVRAILASDKTQTRRNVIRLTGFGKITEFDQSDTAGYDWHFRDSSMRWNDLRHSELLKSCPHGQVGDRLWVRETFVQGFDYDASTDRLRQYDDQGNELPMKAWYRATDSISWSDDAGWETKVPWKPSIHMPRAASRILLEITGVRVERLQDISEQDAIAEGCRAVPGAQWQSFEEARARLPMHDHKAVDAFEALWEDLNGDGSWAANPWVWVVEFKRTKA